MENGRALELIRDAAKIQLFAYFLIFTGRDVSRLVNPPRTRTSMQKRSKTSPACRFVPPFDTFRH